MEQSNNNRTGNNGGNRGGRNYGGRSSGGQQDGGRGATGRGNGGGYCHGGLGNRNYQQQYSNQHQDQYQEQYGGGRGRGRESGGIGIGRGRDQQAHRTPANPWQNADRAPDRVDGAREGITWSRVASGQPVGPPRTQTLNQNRTGMYPREVLQALDVVMKAHLFREKVSVGRGMYSRAYESEGDLGFGVAAYRGSQQSLKVTSNGLVMCTDYSMFFIEMGSNCQYAVKHPFLKWIGEGVCA